MGHMGHRGGHGGGHGGGKRGPGDTANRNEGGLYSDMSGIFKQTRATACPDITRAADGGLQQAAACGASDQAAERPRRLDFSDMDLPECLLIKPIRLWLHGPENWNLVGMQYRAHFGPKRTVEAPMALRGVIETLNDGGRRMMHFHKAWRRITTGDERALVALAAAVQAGDTDRAAAMVVRLVGASWQAQLLIDMASLTAVFTDKGHRFVHLPPRGRGRDANGIRMLASEPPRRTAPASRP